MSARNLATGALLRASVDADGKGVDGCTPTISADATTITYCSYGQATPDRAAHPLNPYNDVFVISLPASFR